MNIQHLSDFFHVFRRENVKNLQDFPRFFLGEIGEHRLKLGVGVKQKMSGGSYHFTDG